MSDERALIDLATLHYIEKVVHDAVDRHDKEKQPVLEDIKRRFDEINERIDELEQLIRSGFPNGDPVGHCNVHEGYIQDAKDRKETLAHAKREVIKYSSVGLFVLVMTSIWEHIKALLTK